MKVFVNQNNVHTKQKHKKNTRFQYGLMINTIPYQWSALTFNNLLIKRKKIMTVKLSKKPLTYNFTLENKILKYKKKFPPKRSITKLI